MYTLFVWSCSAVTIIIVASHCDPYRIDPRSFCSVIRPIRLPVQWIEAYRVMYSFAYLFNAVFNFCNKNTQPIC